MERPILLSVDGQARQLVEASGGSVFVPPEDASALAEAIQGLAGKPGELTAMGRAGREFVLRHYDRASQAVAYRQLLAEVSSQASGLKPTRS